MKEDIKKIREMMEFLIKPKVLDILSKKLKDSKLKLLYELTDGKIKVNEIIKQTGFSAGKISNTWKSWYSEGIIKKEGRLYKKVF